MKMRGLSSLKPRRVGADHPHLKHMKMGAIGHTAFPPGGAQAFGEGVGGEQAFGDTLPSAGPSLAEPDQE